MTYGLTPRMAQLMDFIRAYVERHGYPPSYQEMADGIGIASKSGINRLVKSLEERGLVKFLPYRPRSLVLTECSTNVLDPESTTYDTIKASDGGAGNTCRRSDQSNLSKEVSRG